MGIPSALTDGADYFPFMYSKLVRVHSLSQLPVVRNLTQVVGEIPRLAIWFELAESDFCGLVRSGGRNTNCAWGNQVVRE